MAIEIVSFPINSMVIFQFAMLVYQRVMKYYTVLEIVTPIVFPMEVPHQAGFERGEPQVKRANSICASSYYT